MSVNPKRVLVTGGGGFLGKHICQELSARGYEVFSFSRNDFASQHEVVVTCRQGNLVSYEDVRQACRGMDAVIHTAAKAGVWGRYEDFYQTNVVGTQNVIRAVCELGISTLVYTSSPSVVFGAQDIEGANESLAYPQGFYADYPLTKSLAEQEVLSAARRGLFRGLAIRPHLIWGPGDPHFAPRLRERAKQGRLRRVGGAQNLVDIIYVKNAAKAHVDAMEALVQRPEISGQAFFVGQERAVNLWDFVDQLLVAYGESPLPVGALGARTAYFAGVLMEWVFRRLNLYDREPPLTRFVALQLTKSHYFDHTAAKKAFGYRPWVSIEEGLRNIRSALPKDF